jgi:predicted DNA binding CopG/RHH family protein
MNKDKRLEIRIPESELKASQDTAKALNMHHSEFVREAIKFSISSIKAGIKNAVDNESINPHKE